MFGRDSTDRKEHLKDPYPGLFQNPPLLYPEFDVDKSLPLICYRILVDGEQDAAGEFHCGVSTKFRTIWAVAAMAIEWSRRSSALHDC